MSTKSSGNALGFGKLQFSFHTAIMQTIHGNLSAVSHAANHLLRLAVVSHRLLSISLVRNGRLTPNCSWVSTTAVSVAVGRKGR